MVYDTIPRGAVIKDRYVVREVIGRGGGGIVYTAFDRNLQLNVVLKQIREDVSSLLDSRAEVDILKQLKHERLPKVLDFFEYDGRLFTSMDFIRGIDLNTALKTQGRFLQGQVLRWAQELSDALAYLHSQKPPVIHSDIKPANIMYDPETNGVTLIDFNISLAFSRSKLGTTWISPGYSPPEQYYKLSDYYQLLEKAGSRSAGNRLNGSHNTDGGKFANYGDPVRQVSGYDRYTLPIVAQTVGKGVDARSDVYSFGVTMYHLLTGVKPDPDYANIIPISEYDIDLEPAFALIIEKCMALDPNERYPDGIALNKALHNIYKLDDDYKEFIKRERKRRLWSGILIGFGIAMIAAGFYAVNASTGREYNRIVAEARACSDSGEYPEALEALEDAMEILPNRIDAYVEKARSQYFSGDFDGVIETVDETENKKIKKRKSDASQWGVLYYISGEAYFEKSDYSNANKAFNKAIGEDGSNSLYYRERAVTLARGGNPDEAENVLENAKEMNLDMVSVTYTEAEIACAKGEDEKAIGLCQDVLDSSSDEEISSRSVLMVSKIYGKSGEYDKKIDFLNRYVENDRFGIGMQMQLSYELANAWILKGNSKANDVNALADCSRHALDELLKIYDFNNSTGTINDLETISKLYQNIGELDKSREFADQMITDYPESYACYKRKAFVSLYIEAGKAENMRSYSEFKVNYEKAKELYSKEKNQSDPEMETLEKEHDNLVKGGRIT